jgi:hypothetical protein
MMALDEESDVKLSVVKQDVASIPSYCSDCNCGKKAQSENG